MGQSLATRLGISYYDKELLRLSAGSIGFNPDIFDHADESRPSMFSSLLSMVGVPADSAYNTSSMSHEGLYRAQSRVLTQLAEKGACVIVGRTADYVLREHPGMVSLFLHAPLDFRAANIVARGEATDMEHARQLAKKKDRMRENYYNFFTGRHWGHADNYHLSLDASQGSPETIADMILECISRRKKV